MTLAIDRVVVWGNCQAAPLADLLRAPLAARGLQVVDVPPVYLVTPHELDHIRAELRKTALFISQPVSDEYGVPGCGTDQLAALLPPSARVVRLPVVYDVGAFPFQSRGYSPAGRVDAPLTDYHDLRIVRAAARNWTTAQTVARWTGPTPQAVRAVAAQSLAELRRRETGLDVAAADLVGTPDALWTMTHPTNRVLATLARRVLDSVRIPALVEAPEREYLGQRRTPLDTEVVTVRGWPPDAVRPHWLVDGAALPLAEVVDAHLEFYAARPDVVTATLHRLAPRLRLLEA